jgi:hypothetical protein
MSNASHEDKEPVQALPLYRLEAIAARQHSSFGHITLVQPLPLALLTGVTLAGVLTVLLLLVFGRYSEVTHLQGALIRHGDGAQRDQSARSDTVASDAARIVAPASIVATLTPGTRMHLYCRSCGASGQERSAVVTEISPIAQAVGDCQASPQATGNYGVIVSFFPPIPLKNHETSGSGEVKIDAALPPARKSLLKWMFNRQESTKPQS